MFDFIEFIVLNKFQKKCTHEHALIDANEGYCPDCGKYLKKYFYIVRCKHCEIKREAKMKNGLILPSTNFCPNCGGNEFYIERLEKINITDVRYVICKKEVLEEVCLDITQVWAEREDLKFLKDFAKL